jgi:glycosyltransferase involved in cell wall biosynthesis
LKLHTVIVSFNRLHLTKQVIQTYLETVTLPFSLWVVDNNSDPETKDWLLKNYDHGLSLLDENRFPGYATNLGFSFAPSDATLLHRADNDFSFVPGWCKQVEAAFGNPKLGQLGLRTNKEEGDVSTNVGGCCVILRKLWDKGLRYDERPWGTYDPGYSEDSYLSPAIVKMGYTWKRVSRPALNSLATGDWGDDYYRTSYGIRGITPRSDDPTVPEGFVPYQG